ncbi:hypothetical protein ACI6Q2_22960 [Chitinophagaceae bacterium LWZ2-11]
MNTPTKLLLAIAVISFAACGDDKKQDVTESVNKNGSIETSVTVEHVDSTHDVLVTTHKVWANFNEFKTIVYQDTIPALGTVNTTAENADGDTKKVAVKKDYEIFITVK